MRFKEHKKTTLLTQLIKHSTDSHSSSDRCFAFYSTFHLCTSPAQLPFKHHTVGRPKNYKEHLCCFLITCITSYISKNLNCYSPTCQIFTGLQIFGGNKHKWSKTAFLTAGIWEPFHELGDCISNEGTRDLFHFQFGKSKSFQAATTCLQH